MAKVKLDGIMTEVENILGTSARIEINANDPKISGVISELQKARTRLELTKRGLAIDFDVDSDNLTIYRVGALGTFGTSPTGTDPGEKAKKTPKKKPVPKRSQHTFLAPKSSSDLIDILGDEASHVVWFQGPTGCGKTVLAHYLARELGMVLYQINGHAEMGHEDFFGDKTVEIDEASGQNHMVYQDGPAVLAMEEGLDENGNEVGPPAILFIDEAASIPPHIAIGLNRLLESDDPRRTITLTKDKGRVVRSHSGMRIILGANTIGRGVTDLNDAAHTAQTDALDISLLNRISVVFRFGYNRKVERHILQEKIGDDRIVKQIEDYRDAIRDHIRAGQCSTAFATRDLVKVADQYRIFKNLGKAIYYAVFGILLPEERAIYNETFMRLHGTDLIKEFTEDDVDYMTS